MDAKDGHDRRRTRPEHNVQISDEWRRATSIRRRILLPLVPLIALALLITAYAIYVSIQRELIAGLDRTLLAMARGVGAAVDVELDGELEFELEGPAALVFQGPEATAFYVVRKPDGGLWQSALESPPAIAPSAAGETVYATHAIKGTRYRVCTQTILREPDDDAEDRAEWLAENPGEPLPDSVPQQFQITVGHVTRSVDGTLAALRTRLAIVLGGLCVVLTLLPAGFVSAALRPLRRLAENMYAFGTGEEVEDLAPAGRRDEIGVLQNEFYSMVARIKSAEVAKEELARVRAEREKQELREKLRQAQKMEALGTLAGGIAHDFNNILTPIMGYTEMSQDELPEGSSARRKLDQVIVASRRAQDLVRQILAFSRQGQGEKTPMRVAPVVKETLKLLRASYPANVEIQSEVPTGTGMVLGNPSHIHQVILNLATNACQAMVEKGGRLDVRMAEEGYEDAIDVGNGRLLPPGGYLHLTVADTGGGIRPDVIDRIYEPYFTTKKEGEGTGLGLATVHGIVKDMGGAIQVDSEVGRGTQFDVFLPLEEAGTESGADRTDPIPTGFERILVLDDERPTAEMLGEMLETLGYHVTVTTRPTEAVEMVALDPDAFDLIVSDVAMPEMTGVELARALAEQGAQVPIVLCSGYTGGINWRAAQAVGIQAAVMKPVVKRDIGCAVRSALDGESTDNGGAEGRVPSPTTAVAAGKVSSRDLVIG